VNVRTYIERGLSLLQAGMAADAEPYLRNALGLLPQDDQLMNLLAAALMQQGRIVEAEPLLRQALGINRRQSVYHDNLGCALAEQGRLDESRLCFERAIKLNPGDSQAYYNLGKLMAISGEFSGAEIALRKAMRLDNSLTDAMFQLVYLLSAVGDYEGALKTLDAGLRSGLDTGKQEKLKAPITLMLGMFEQGWHGYLWRSSRRDWFKQHGMPAPMPVAVPLLAADLQGRDIHVAGEQGLGDELFFARFLPELLARGARVHYHGNARLVALLRRAGPGEGLVVDDAAAPAGGAVLAGDLPYLLEAHLRPVPPTLRISPLAERATRWQATLASLGPRPWLGLTWRAGTDAGHGKAFISARPYFKDIGLPDLAEAVRGWPGTLFSLQRSPREGEREALSGCLGRDVHDLSAVNADLEDALAVCALLDEYVGVSNTNMHLRAAAGRPAQVLVPEVAEYRWMARGEVSPWFPDFRVHRKCYGKAGWADAIASVRAVLRLP
jgi:Tfp pilus assembly protein PilF